MSIKLYLRRTYRPPEPPRTPGTSPTPSSPRITLIVTVQVLSQSTLSRSSVCNKQSDLVVAHLLKSSRTFSLDVTRMALIISACLPIWSITPKNTKSRRFWTLGYSAEDGDFNIWSNGRDTRTRTTCGSIRMTSSRMIRCGLSRNQTPMPEHI